MNKFKDICNLNKCFGTDQYKKVLKVVISHDDIVFNHHGKTKNFLCTKFIENSQFHFAPIVVALLQACQGSLSVSAGHCGLSKFNCVSNMIKTLGYRTFSSAK